VEVAAMYFCYGYALNMFIAYYPKYLDAARGYSLKEMGFSPVCRWGRRGFGDICGGLFSTQSSTAQAASSSPARAWPSWVPGSRRSAARWRAGARSLSQRRAVRRNRVRLELVVATPGRDLGHGGQLRRLLLGGYEHRWQYRGAIMATVTVFIVNAWGWNSAFYAVSVLSLLGALLFTQIDAVASWRPKARVR